MKTTALRITICAISLVMAGSVIQVRQGANAMKTVVSGQALQESYLGSYLLERQEMLRSLEYRKDEPNVQRRTKKANEIAPEQVPVGCDAAASYLDFAVIETKKLEDSYLIVVSRLGIGESSRLNRIRLAAAEEYVRRRGSDFKYVLAQGNRTKGLGQLELFVGGRLYKIMPYEKNAKGFCIPGREGW